MVDRAACAHRVGRDIHTKSFTEQVVDRLPHANVRLNAADQNLPDSPVAPAAEYLATFAAAKGEFAGNGLQPRGQFGGGRPQPLRILLGRGNRHAKNLGSIDQPADVPNQSRMSQDQRQQLRLHIDD